MAVLTLQNFLVLAPVWDQRQPLSDLLGQLLLPFHQTGGLTLQASLAGVVVVDDQQRPQGWLPGLTVLAWVQCQGHDKGHASLSPQQWCPLETLSVDLTPEQFWQQLQQRQLLQPFAQVWQTVWALVNAQGEFLGLLDATALIFHLASPPPQSVGVSASATTPAPLPPLSPKASSASVPSLLPNSLQRLPTPAPEVVQSPWIVLQQLQQQVADLKLLNQQHQDFLGAISHELKTPLTAILGLTTVLKGQSLGTLSSRQENYVNLLHQSGRNAMSLVNYLLDLAQIEAGQQHLHADVLEILSLCERSFELAQQSIPNSESVQLCLDLPPDLPPLIGDGRQLRQTLVNLFGFILRFAPPQAQIKLQLTACPGWICWQVSAPGLVIPLEQQPYLLEQFVQLAHGRDPQFPATGLGLLLARRLAQLQGGELAFVAWPEQVCQFSLCLPQPLTSPSLAPMPESEQVELKRELRLALIAETDSDLQQQLFIHLQAHHYLPVLARSATELQTKARLLQPAVIFLNLSQVGNSALTYLSTTAQTQHLPIAVLEQNPQVALSEAGQVVFPLPLEPAALNQFLNQLDIQTPKSGKPLSWTAWNLSSSRLPHPEDTIPGSRSNLTVLRVGHSMGCPLPQCRILEADDLEQAELLARIWQPDILLWDWLEHDPTPELRALSRHPRLVNLPLVTLDLATTRAATQFSHLQVFPCLVAETLTTTPSEQVAATLWQVVQVAAQAAQPHSNLE